MSKNNKKYFEKSGKANLTTGKIKIKENINIFKCPVCGDKMNLDVFKSIICLNKHCFDISKKGYINLLLKPSKYKYDKEMFEARNSICKMGFFDPLIESIVSLIYNNISINSSNNISYTRILDAGCGEGYHLSQVMKKLQKKEDVHFQGVGIDISKDGIQFAAKNYKDIIWCVADLAKIPFMDKKFDIVLNILSPSNYSEFNRIIHSEGILIKVVPNSGYLKELRDLLYQGTNRELYSNEKVIEHFNRNFEKIDTEKVSYNVSVSRDELSHLIKMTPLSWGASEGIIKKVLDNKIDSITVDFTIIIGKSKKQISLPKWES
ncbi:MAG: methyltransferase domain-containing protein [Clostridiales bacterium]|nr:methyltransferase domain-containing protein [Clostridiales bacterium]